MCITFETRHADKFHTLSGIQEKKKHTHCIVLGDIATN